MAAARTFNCLGLGPGPDPGSAGFKTTSRHQFPQCAHTHFPTIGFTSNRVMTTSHAIALGIIATTRRSYPISRELRTFGPRNAKLRQRVTEKCDDMAR
jgi:hypothetical protein